MGDVCASRLAKALSGRTGDELCKALLRHHLSMIDMTPDKSETWDWVTTNSLLKNLDWAKKGIPFATRWHYVPHEYWRFTLSGVGAAALDRRHWTRR